MDSKISNEIEFLKNAATMAESACASLKGEEIRRLAFSQFLSYFLGSSIIPRAKSTTNIREGFQKPVTPKKPKSQSSTGPKAWITELLAEGFFETPQNMQAILTELSERSHHLKATDLTRPLESLCHDRQLRRKKILVSGAEGKSKAALHWSNW
jgi:hypothetical protein